MEIIFATKNAKKLREIKEIMTGFSVVSMEETGIDAEILEDGETFRDNAVKKAVAVMELSGKLVLADDSGLEIDFLNGAPGVHSARYMGEDTSYDVKNRKILELMREVQTENRGARFVCAIAAAFPDGRVIVEQASVEGAIAPMIMGNNGFGYDPIFYVPEFKMTTAEMPPGLKNSISHRGKALRLMKSRLDLLI